MSHQLYLPPGGDSLLAPEADDWMTRPSYDWKPFGSINSQVRIPTKSDAVHEETIADRNGGTVEFKSTLAQSVLVSAQENVKMIWNEGADTQSLDGGFTYWVYASGGYRSYVFLGLPKAKMDVGAAVAAPVKNFIGIKFYFTTRGTDSSAPSSWAPRIDDGSQGYNNGVALQCFDPTTQKTYLQTANLASYQGQNPEVGNSPTSTYASAAYTLSDEDQTWVMDKGVYLTGIYIALRVPSADGVQRNRKLTFGRLMVTYNRRACPILAPKSSWSGSTDQRTMVLPDSENGAIAADFLNNQKLFTY